LFLTNFSTPFSTIVENNKYSIKTKGYLMVLRVESRKFRISLEVGVLVVKRISPAGPDEEKNRCSICQAVESKRVGSEDRGRENRGPKEKRNDSPFS
jgi:hypothetical protein